MIPSTNNILLSDLALKRDATKTYKIHLERNIIGGKCDHLEAMTQAIYKILNTERYENIIYSWNYGIELFDLYGEPTSFICSELQERITEALLQDDRINSVDSFEFDISKKGTIKVDFVTHTIFGDIQSEKVVNV